MYDKYGLKGIKEGMTHAGGMQSNFFLKII